MVYGRLPWTDRFNEPTPRQLRNGLPTEVISLFDRARAHLRGLKGINECTAWYGHCWRWAIEYRTSEQEDPLAILIPSPSDLQLAMPLDPAFLTALPINRLKRAVRDGLDLARDPFDTRWGVWSLQTEPIVEELERLIDRRLTHLHGARRN